MPVRLIASLLCLLYALPGLAAEAVESAPQRLAANAWLLPGQLRGGSSPDGNSVVLRGPDGLVVIDTGRGGEHTARLLDFLRSLRQPVRAVVNSHWHLDHIGGNARFKQAMPGVAIHTPPGLDRALAGFHADNRRDLAEYLGRLPAHDPQRPLLETELALLRRDRELAGTTPVTRPGAVRWGGRWLGLHWSKQAVTDADIWLTDAAEGLLIAGDLVTLPVPLFDTACPEHWQRTLAELDRLSFRTLIPGHGAPMTHAAFSAYRAAFDRLLACAAEPGDGEACIAGWFQDAAPAGAAEGADRYPHELLRYYLDGVLKPGSPAQARWCAPP